MMRRATLCLLALLAGASAQAQPALQRPTIIPPSQAVFARHGMVVAQEARAARIGVEILQKGGNAVDAAVAVGFAMAVTYPRAGNIGGGGFMLVHLARGGDVAIDYREVAPAAITRTSFLDAKGEPDIRKSRDSALAIGVPGTVAGLALAHQKYGSGKFTLAELIAPAIALAADGIPVSDDIADSLPFMGDRLSRWPSSARIFAKDGKPLAAGDTMVQADLAQTLRAIAAKGPDAFYKGDIAVKIAAAVRENGGVMTADDLAAYQAEIRRPVYGSYRGYRIVSMPPPSSGGIALIETLNVLEGYDLGRLGPASPQAAHLLVEAMKRAYADRARFLGDPASVRIPKELTAKRYAAALRRSIGDRATPAAEVKTGAAVMHEGANTTHFSIVDRSGNAVANTYTLNFSYGVGLVAEGTGVLLNNELDDFTAKPGAANAFGLVGYEANLPGPGKKPLSSMTPTIVMRGNRPFLVTGSPGGSRIISAVLQVISNALDYRMAIDAAVSAPRLHHQWLPDEILAENGYPRDVLQELANRGHKVGVGPPGTSANSLAVTAKGYAGAADMRTRGALATGY
jgi:gamma-glutamyltranspeptidase/glutathione hydrolase